MNFASGKNIFGSQNGNVAARGREGKMSTVSKTGRGNVEGESSRGMYEEECAWTRCPTSVTECDASLRLPSQSQSIAADCQYQIILFGGRKHV